MWRNLACACLILDMWLRNNLLYLSAKKCYHITQHLVWKLECISIEVQNTSRKFTFLFWAFLLSAQNLFCEFFSERNWKFVTSLAMNMLKFTYTISLTEWCFTYYAWFANGNGYYWQDMGVTLLDRTKYGSCGVCIVQLFLASVTGVKIHHFLV